jgi:glyoxylase-like metal-dependent hydrolase (beta-lactamase superfamily II)
MAQIISVMNPICVKLAIRSSGHCWASAHHVVKGDAKVPIRFEATWAEISHPKHGLVLFDTGYTSRFHTSTENFPNSIYAQMTRVEIKTEDEAKMQVIPSSVRHLILSHLHADHVGGLRDFETAVCWTSEACISEFETQPKWRAFAKGLLHNLFPPKWSESCKTFESCAIVSHDILGRGRDLFEDGSIVLFPLPGHAAGQHGALIQTDKGPVFLVADAFWDIRAITHGLGPAPIVRLFFDDWKAYNTTLNKLRQFHRNHPEIPLFATHCPRTAAQIVKSKMTS